MIITQIITKVSVKHRSGKGETLSCNAVHKCYNPLSPSRLNVLRADKTLHRGA